MEVSFTESGINSKAWWIKLIKDYGHDSGRWELQQVAKTSHEYIKVVLDHLVGGAYIQMQGKGGADGYKYVVTSLGHRYLNEHPEELESVEFVMLEPGTIEVSPGSTVDPLFPKSAEVKGDPDCHYCRRRGTACTRHGGAPSATKVWKDKRKLDSTIADAQERINKATDRIVDQAEDNRILAPVRMLEPVVYPVPRPTLPVVDENTTTAETPERMPAPSEVLVNQSSPTVLADTLEQLLKVLVIERYTPKVTAVELIEFARERGL